MNGHGETGWEAAAVRMERDVAGLYCRQWEWGGNKKSWVSSKFV